VSATDPLVFIVAPAAVTLTGLLASYLPTRRAIAADPVQALKEE
jgi:ABC-type lipoprotein release transport system permease subunit